MVAATVAAVVTWLIAGAAFVGSASLVVVAAVLALMMALGVFSVFQLY